MIPPCDQSVLNANPLFKSLHQQLTSDILNPDGSTRALGAQGSKNEVRNDLKARQVLLAKKRILARVIGQLAYDSENGLPGEIRDLVLIIALYLQRGDTRRANGCNSDECDDHEIFSLLAPDIDTFHPYIPSITPAISKLLASELAHLKTLANAPGTSPVRGDRETRGDESVRTRENAPKTLAGQRHATSVKQSTADNSTELLSAQLSNRLGALRETQMKKLPAAQREVADTAALVLAAQTLVLERTIHILERTKHGTLARAERARAEHLAKVAEGLDGKVNVLRQDVLSAVYTPETTAALARYRDHLRDTRPRLEERQHNALRELAVYEGRNAETNRDAATGSRTPSRTAETPRDRKEGHDNEEDAGPMAALAKKYGVLVKDVEAVRLEIEKLGG